MNRIFPGNIREFPESRRVTVNPEPSAHSSRPRALRRLTGVALAVVLLGGSALYFRPGRPSAEHRRSNDLPSALAMLGDGRLDQAEAALQAELDAHPDSPAATEELQWLYFNQFRVRELEQFLEGRIEAAPGNPAWLHHALMSEIRSPVPREGLGYLESIQARQPGQTAVLRGLGYCQWQLGELRAAWRLIDAALKSRPEDVETRLLAAEFLIEQGRWAAAGAVLNDDGLRPAFEADDRWWSTQSRLSESEGDPPAALARLERALQLRPFELKYVHRRAVLLSAAGRKPEAAEAFEIAGRWEACQKQLTEVALSGRLQQPEPELCLEVAELYDCRARPFYAERWRRLAARLDRREP